MGFAENISTLMEGRVVRRAYELRDLSLKTGIILRTVKADMKKDGKDLPYDRAEKYADALDVTVQTLMGSKPITEADKLIGKGHRQELAEPVTAVEEEEPACSCDGATGEGQKCNECGDGVVGD
jgi:hypothetical protein